MPKYRVCVDWSQEVEAKNETEAKRLADSDFEFMNEATVEEVEEEDEKN
jgi:hypothetical protein